MSFVHVEFDNGVQKKREFKGTPEQRKKEAEKKRKQRAKKNKSSVPMGAPPVTVASSSAIKPISPAAGPSSPFPAPSSSRLRTTQSDNLLRMSPLSVQTALPLLDNLQSPLSGPDESHTASRYTHQNPDISFELFNHDTAAVDLLRGPLSPMMPSTPGIPLSLVSAAAADAVNPKPMDFSLQVLGVELSENAPVIEWPGGYKTVVPFLPAEDDPTKNVLQLDEDGVRRLVDHAAKGGAASFVKYFKREREPSKLVELLRPALGRGDTVVILDFEEPGPYTFSQPYIVRERRLNNNKTYDIHYARERLTTFSAPQVQGTLDKIFKDVFNINEIPFILDIPSVVTDSPKIINLLDDAEEARITMDDLSESLKDYKDTFKTRFWELLHGAGVLTFEHHDAEGFLTWLRMLSGGKVWAIVRPAGYTEARTRKALNNLNCLFLREDWTKRGLVVPETWKLDWEAQGGEVHAILVKPGDLVIMPPGTWHTVYTPVCSVAAGGHFYMYETLHLTEVSRAFDRPYGLCVTNTSHVSAYSTLCGMMVNTIRGDHLTLRLKPLQALCRMVIKSSKYIASTGDPKLTKSVKHDVDETIPKLAKTVAEYFVRRLGLDPEDPDYLFRHGESWMDPGAIVDMTDIFNDWTGTPLRRGNLTNDQLPTIKDILSGKWTPPSERDETPPSNKRRQSQRNLDKSKKAKMGQ